MAIERAAGERGSTTANGLMRLSWRFELRGGRVSQRYGIIAREEQSVRLNDLRSIELDQSLVQRLLGIGDIAFYSVGFANTDVSFVGICAPPSGVITSTTRWIGCWRRTSSTRGLTSRGRLPARRHTSEGLLLDRGMPPRLP